MLIFIILMAVIGLICLNVPIAISLALVLTSKSGFGKLPADVQAALREAAVETQAYVYETAARLENELLTVIKDAGVAVNTADKAAFIAASKPIYDDYASSVKGGDALISKVQNAAK